MADLKNMTRKEKIEYIWDYYKIHIIGGIFYIIILVSFIHGQVTKVDYVANLTILTPVGDNIKLEEAQKELTNVVVKDGDKKKQVLIDYIPIINPENPEPQMLQKFTVKMAAKEIDVIVLDKEIFDSLMKQGVFMDLSKVKEIDIQNIKADKIEGTSSDGKDGIYGISAEGNSILEGMKVDTKNKVIAIMEGTERENTAVSIFKWLIGK